MGVLSDAQKHVNCFDQVSSVLPGHLASKSYVFTKFKARFGSWCFTSSIYPLFYIFGLHTLSTCWGWYRNHKKMHKSCDAMKQMESCGCCAKAILMKHRHQNNTPATTAVVHHHTGVLNKVLRVSRQLCL